MDERHTSRLLLLDPDNRVLLMRIAVVPEADSGSAHTDDELWVTVGGQIEPGETVLAAAERELHEETGITDARVGPVVWYGEQVLRINGAPRLLKENFVLARCSDSALTDSGWTAEERQAIAEMRWWSLDELAATTMSIKPPMLARVLGELLESVDAVGVQSLSLRRIDLQ